MSTPTRRASGKQGHFRGAELERDLGAVHALLRPRGYYVVRTSPPSKVVRGKGGLRIIYEGHGLPDFHGWGPCGPLTFDAKHVTGTRWELRQLGDYVDPESQARHFDAAVAAGGMAGVVLRFYVGAGAWDYWIGWGRPGDGSLRDRWEEGVRPPVVSGRASLDVAECQRIGIRLCGLDWTAALARTTGQRVASTVTYGRDAAPVRRREPH